MLTDSRPPRFQAELLRRPWRWIGVAALLALAAMHGELFLRRLADNSIAEPSVLLRWLGAAVLLGAAQLWRRTTGRSILTGRSALVFALLVALLHAGLPATPELAGTATVALPGELLVLGLGGLLLAAAAIASAASSSPGLRRGGFSRHAERCRAPRSLPCGLAFSSRPPPAR
jgi:hypothetical protein